eukprot:6214527-Pleurochrysis_carterae.AAC.3
MSFINFAYSAPLKGYNDRKYEFVVTIVYLYLTRTLRDREVPYSLLHLQLRLWLTHKSSSRAAGTSHLGLIHNPDCNYVAGAGRVTGYVIINLPYSDGLECYNDRKY